ncbi:MAG TPA: aminoglycoside phosphotransferase family protein [Anaerovoracaceae bacterium]|nr:aminoglycoside phosphotransferase family protein [Anaerovoracaceae bacterium]
MKFLIDSRVLNAIDAYGFPGEYAGVLPYGQGHINDTYAVYFQFPEGDDRRHILQKINKNVFKKPEEVMENVSRVTAYLREAILKSGGDPDRETMNLIKTLKGRDYFVDEEDEYWRCYVFIEDTITLHTVEKPQDMYEAARVFGSFQRHLTDYPADTLHETILNFHNTRDRFLKFTKALEQDVKNRARDVRDEIDFVIKRQDEAGLLIDLAEKGELPIRVTHNDTKLNNVLIDKNTGKGICAVDLDTVMPGLSLYDFGDAIRFGANPAAEDETDLSKVWMEESLFEAYTEGYLREAGNTLTDREVELLPAGAKMMTLECGIRFLTDYLEGDTYFKIHREHHNLDRCRTQFKLISDMEEKWDRMHDIVKKWQSQFR